MIDIQNIVISLLNQSGKTDSEIEKDLNLPRSTIYDWRNGRSKSYKKYISEVATYFGVSADYILGNEQKNKPTVSGEPNPRDIRIMELFESLDDNNKKLALAQIETMLKFQDNK